MSLPLHESRVLALIEMGLCREDRELAALFAAFNRLSEAGTPPRRDRLPSRRLCLAMTAAIVAGILVLGVIAAALSG